jgi:hypothetical protein
MAYAMVHEITDVLQGVSQKCPNLFDCPNHFGLPAFYTLHVRAWKDNPNGAFVNWHPNASGQSFAGQNR